MVSYNSLGPPPPPPPPTVHVYKSYRNIVKPCKQRLHVLVRVITPKSRTCRYPLIRLFNIMVLKKNMKRTLFYTWYVL